MSNESIDTLLYPKIEPFSTTHLRVSDIHEIYVEVAGNPQGRPVLFLHGGPGAGAGEMHRRLFDPAVWKIVIFDQRGCGRSRPHAELRENTTWDLVADIERIRMHLGIERWLVFGGSWGSTLSLAYAETHPERVAALVLRGIFLCRKAEIDWFYQSGAHWLFPDFWNEYIAPIPNEERGDLLAAHYSRLTSSNREAQMASARAWSGWEGSTLHLRPQEAARSRFTEDAMALALARIEAHYFKHGCWFRDDNQLLADVPKIRHIPATIVHGRYDVVCPIKSAFDLHAVWPESKFEIIPDAGHAVDEPGILRAVMAAADSYRHLPQA